MHISQETLFQQAKRQKSNQRIAEDDVLFFEIRTEDLQPPELRPVLSGAFIFVWVIQGRMTLSVNYQQETAHKHHIVLLTPRTVISWVHTDPDFQAYVLCFDPDFFDSLSTHAHFYNQWTAYLSEYASSILPLHNPAWSHIIQTVRLFPSIREANLHPNGMLRHLSNFLSLQIADALHEKCPRKNGKIAHAVELYQRFRKLLATHYKQQHNLAFYADLLCISSTYLSRIIRQVSNNTGNHHIARMLLIEARYLLDCTDLTIKQIAEELHFADQASFGKFFKAQMQLSPTMYRKKIGT